MDHLSKEIKEIEQNVRELERNNKALSSKYEAAKKDLEATQTKLSKISFDPSKEAQLIQQKEKEEKIIAELKQVDIMPKQTNKTKQNKTKQNKTK